VALETLDGSEASPQLREAEAVVLATFRYMAKTEATIRLSTQRWQRPWEWLTGGLLMSAYTSLHAAETNRILLLGSDQLAALLPAVRQRAVKYLPAGDPRLVALQGLPDPTEPTHQALARVQNTLVQTVTVAHAAAQAQEKASLSAPKNTQGSGEPPTPAGGRQEPQGTGAQSAPQVAQATEKPGSDTQASGTALTSSEADTRVSAKAEPGQAPPDGGTSGPGGGNGANGGPRPVLRGRTRTW
jgi:hypothetical protein